MTNKEAKALFEEALKDGKCSNDCPEYVEVEDIDNLVKEMVGNIE